MAPTITIGRRFNGPPQSGNGGYACGAMANAIGQPLRVRLKKPLSLDTVLAIEQVAPQAWQLLNGGEMLATATPATVEATVPDPPEFQGAQRSRSITRRPRTTSCRTASSAARRARRVTVGGSSPPLFPALAWWRPPGCRICRSAMRAAKSKRNSYGPRSIAPGRSLRRRTNRWFSANSPFASSAGRALCGDRLADRDRRSQTPGRHRAFRRRPQALRDRLGDLDRA